MLRTELSRIYELVDSARQLDAPDAYFQDFEQTIEESPVKKKVFRDWEALLGELDDEAWSRLKAKALRWLCKKDAVRGWHQLFETLNEAKGYCHLKQLGCERINFIFESKINGQETPDIEGYSNGQRVFCEVKMINVSVEEAKARLGHVARGIASSLSPEFLSGKFRKTLEKAHSQLFAYDSSEGVRRVVYVAYNDDDNLSEYIEQKIAQIRDYVERHPIQGIEVTLDYRPPFYNAMA